MKTRLLEGLNTKDQEQFKYEFEKAFPFRKHLIGVLMKDIETALASMTKEEGFDSPSWALIQADRIAQIKTYKKIIALLE